MRLSNTKGQTTDGHKIVDTRQKHSAKWKSPDRKGSTHVGFHAVNLDGKIKPEDEKPISGCQGLGLAAGTGR